MYLGRVVELAPTDTLIADPAHPYAEALMAAIPEADPDLTRSKQRVALRSAEVPSLLHAATWLRVPSALPALRRGLCDVRPELVDRASARSPATSSRARTGQRDAVPA